MKLLECLKDFISEEREYDPVSNKDIVAFLLDTEGVIKTLYNESLKNHIENNPEFFKNCEISLKCKGVDKNLIEETIVLTKYILE